MIFRVLFLVASAAAFVVNNVALTSRTCTPRRSSLQMAREMTEKEKKEKYWQVNLIESLSFLDFRGCRAIGSLHHTASDYT